MARRSFIVPATVHANTHALTAWTARTGGSQITDLLDASGAATATLVGTGADPLLFSGPADGTGALWLQLGELASAPRRKVTADDYPLADINAASSASVGTDFWFGYSDNLTAPGLFTFSGPVTDGDPFVTLSVDGQTVTFNESCVAVLSFEPGYDPDADATGSCVLYLAGTILSEPYLAADNEQMTTRIAASAVVDLLSGPIWTTPPMKITAGDTLQVGHAVNFGSGLITAHCYLGIVKLGSLPN